MFGNKIGKIVADKVTVKQVKEVAGEVTESVIETGVDAVTTGAKSVIHGIMFTVAAWVIGITVVVTGAIYGLGALFS